MTNLFGSLSSSSIITVVITVMSFAGTVLSQPKSVITPSNRFGINLFSELSKQNADNLIFSPFSVALSLSMVYQGSEGSTNQQLKSVLGEQFVRSNSSQLLENSSNDEQGYQLDTANALLSSVEVLESYKNKLVSQFGAELFQLNNAKANMKLINEWCSNKTNGKIDKMLSEPPSPNTLMVLLNAIYFKGTWLNKFDKESTKKKTFYGVNNKTTTVPFMRQRGRFNVVHLKKTNSTMIEFPYKGGDVSFFAILPDQNGTTANDIELLPESLDHFLKNKRTQEAIVTIPKFKLDSRFDLVVPVTKLGLGNLFGGNAQLTGISPSSATYISDIIQKATIEVNEEGSVAAAITYIEMTRSSRPRLFEYNFDRPFLFLIYHRRSGHILFAGRINGF